MANLSHLHESVNSVLYAAAVKTHPQAADLWKKIQALDKEKENCSSAAKKEILASRVDKLEKDLESAGIMTIDSGDIEKVIQEWVS